MRNKLEVDNLIPENLTKRILTSLPEHFKTVILNVTQYELISIKKWLYFNTRGRISITKSYINDPKLGIDGRWCFGFEDPVELTFFSLGCSYIKPGN